MTTFTLVTNAAEETNTPPSEAELAIKKFKLADGFKAELFAAEPMLANPVAFALDEKGRAYVVETYRLKEGVFDIRDYEHWLNEELAAQTIDDHLAKIKNHLSEVPDMTRASEKISLITDTDGDGKADKFSTFARDFTNALDGIASGVLPYHGDVYFTCIPSLHLLRDTDNDGQADERKALQTGYGVRFGFIGHDLHGLIIGPDGRLYFSIGDRGFSVKQGERTIAFPDGGAIFRCELDGSNLEIFHYGLRNPQELAFDKYGNLFTGDNNSDAGDQARFVYAVEGGDSGWRVGWQFLNEPHARGSWNSERMWDPEKAGQVGYIVPPLANIASGPSGLAYYPGVGLPEKFNDGFLLCDFRGTQNGSQVHIFANKPKGASFEVVNRDKLISDVLVTDVTFGPDCAVYILDWVESWGMTGKGRIYRILNDESKSALVEETKKLLGEGMEKRSTEELTRLLGHRDQRVRQEAQFTFSKRGDPNPLVEAATKGENQLARIHALWGIGQIARKSPNAVSSALNSIVTLLGNNDAEVVAQTAKVLGEAKFAPAYDGLLKLLENVNQPRGQFFAALALGKLGKKEAGKPIIEMLRGNDNKDAYLRHAGVMALAWLDDFQSLHAAAKDSSPAVRFAAAVVMRRLHRAEISMFLSDRQQNVVVEAARAINDLPIIQALPELAKLIEQPNYNEEIFRRALNANFRLGTPENAAALAKFAALKTAPDALRAEALDMLAEWSKPPSADRITGLWRPVAPREGKAAADALAPLLSEIVKASSQRVQLAAINFADKFNVKELGPQLFDLLSDTDAKVEVRVAALKLLAKLKDARLDKAIEIAALDPDEQLRRSVLEVRAKLPSSNATGPLVKALESGGIGEKQSAFTALGILKDEAADKVLSEWLDKLMAGNVADEVKLDLIEAAEKRSSDEVKKKLEKFNASRTKDDLELFRECLSGGNAEEGRKIFIERVEASCVRCHKVGPDGGEVGPILDGIGAKKDREYLLRSIVNPNSEVAAGFESVMIFLKNGQAYAGTLKSEDKKEVVLNSPEDGIVKIAKKDIDKRERGLSGMPPELAKVLSKQDLRNVVEFLANLK